VNRGKNGKIVIRENYFRVHSFFFGPIIAQSCTGKKNKKKKERKM